ncbi:MAG TPA: YdcF family protein, partial [Roseiarcus sp.]|nr:YdcF family protein [Roseiarcus sp.]
RSFRSIGIAAILILITVGMTPLGLMAAAPLENRFPQPAADMPPTFGIIVLGGAVNGLVSKARGEIVFDEGERMIEAAFLAKRYPQARVVFTGGSGSLIAESKEAPAARELLIKLGVDPDRIIVEDKSRNTEENARFTAAIVHPEPKQRWLVARQSGWECSDNQDGHFGGSRRGDDCRGATITQALFCRERI